MGARTNDVPGHNRLGAGHSSPKWTEDWEQRWSCPEYAVRLSAKGAPRRGPRTAVVVRVRVRVRVKSRVARVESAAG